MAMRYYVPFPGDGSEPSRPQHGPRALRIGDAERDAAAADLGEHYAAGRLNLDELNQRLDAVFAARTFGQIARVMADLPGPGRLSRPAWPGAGDRAWHAADASVAGFQTKGPHAPPTPSDRAGRFAALSLLVLAMLSWLFTALLFAWHGMNHPAGPYGGPPGPFGHFSPSGPPPSP
jgi:hypothetical protein